IPSAVVMDYEHVKGLKLMRPNWTIIPDIISTAAMASRANRILTYPGIKEDVYAHQFIPNATFRTNLGLTEQNLIVTIRPPAEEAHYHNPESEALLGAVMRLMGNTPATKMIMLPRNQKQEKSIRRLWPELFATNKAVIPEHAVDGLNLIWHSDLVVSGGGTMNRETAALGVPVYSIFRGKIGAVDRYLASNNRLTLLESVKDVRTKLVLERRVRLSRPERANSRALSTIVEHISSVVETSSAKRMNGRNKSTAVRTAD